MLQGGQKDTVTEGHVAHTVKCNRNVAVNIHIFFN